jgi:hypothetical protein
MAWVGSNWRGMTWHTHADTDNGVSATSTIGLITLVRNDLRPRTSKDESRKSLRTNQLRFR